MKKLISVFLCLTVLGGLLCSCSEEVSTPPSPVGIYIYEEEGFGGDFYINIKEDGTFSYSVGMLSSYHGIGEWSLDGDVLRLKDREYTTLKYDNYFKVKEDKLVFISKGSTNFMYLTVANGATFNKQASDCCD